LARGIILHSIVEAFNQSTRNGERSFSSTDFLDLAQGILEKEVPWPSARRLWYGRLTRIADWFVAAEEARSQTGTLVAQEIQGARKATEFDFELTAKADRLDRDPNGKLVVYDYKSGDPPTGKEIKLFDKQLQLEATIAEAGGFENLEPMAVSTLQYIGLKGPDKTQSVSVSDTLVEDTWLELIQLLRCHFEGHIGYGARLKMKMDKYGSDYDQLSRFGEWEETDTPDVSDVP
jgi:RecB family exonuclease